MKSASLPLVALALFVALLVVPDLAFASGSNGGQEASAIYTWLKDGLTGFWGKVLALLALFIGMGFGVARQTVLPALVGVGIALVCNYGPDILEGIFTFAVAVPPLV